MVRIAESWTARFAAKWAALRGMDFLEEKKRGLTLISSQQVSAKRAKQIR